MKKIRLPNRGLMVTLALLALAPLHPATAQTYTITGLGTLGDGPSQATALNNSGQVVGLFTVDGNSHAFVHSGGVMRDLGTLGGSHSIAFDINKSGQVVGGSDSLMEDGSFGPTHAFLYSEGVMRDLGPLDPGTLNPGLSIARSINDSGQIAGYGDVNGEWRAFLYSSNGMKDLGALGGSHSQAQSINASGQVVGLSQTASGDYHAFLYTGGAMRDLGTLGPIGVNGSFSAAYDINDVGQIVGTSIPANGKQHAFLISNGVMQDLGTFEGLPTSAVSINNHGQIVGYGRDSNLNPRPFLYSGGVMKRLQDLLPPHSGWNVAVAFGINDRGQIVGYGFDLTDPRGLMRAFLMTPSSAPADRTAPTTTATILRPGTSDWNRQPVRVSLLATDNPGGSGVASTFYKVDGGANQTYSTPFTISSNGIHTVVYWSVDKAGNRESARTLTVKIDTAPPIVTASANPALLWPPNGSALVTVSGRITDLLSGVKSGSTTYAVADEYGLVQPRGRITPDATGRFSFGIVLDARRDGQDRDGRTYAITLQAGDVAGNAVSAVVTVLVPHSKP